jgi:hypothetical protein
MRKFLLMIVLIISLFIVLPTLAQVVNDPADNWCYDGGPLAGRCTTNDLATTHWMWYYGFYRAQVAKGTLTINDIPENYRVGFPSPSTQGTAVVLTTSGTTVGRSADFHGTISTCRFTKHHLYIEAIWLGLDMAGDRIEISTHEGSVSKNMYVPKSAVDVEFRLDDDPAESITPGGTMSVYYRGVLIGRTSDLNGLYHCEDDT